ncbi:immunity 26/phosphotriesterase HocA family protein [Curtobacterium albidum]|uniref:immunity 26/phosphotriesterase HocA family protein n=1 Tax=Curtobacterium citreum TaxID=2036 RepID=UPI0020265519|nr:immunity 26/phosphotriesterase HocA family protein [Curtobacterium albidum]MCL9665435.1 immunity 26/phosphotriesterase HocA family protein [Curtobacterium albidum]
MSASKDVVRVMVGDVFRVKVDDDRAYVGQVLHVGESAVFIVVFDHLVRHPVAIPDALGALMHQPIVASWTYDARFRPGMWEVITQAQTDTRRYLPASAWGLPETGGVRLTSFDETRTRAATAEEAATIPPRTTRSPMLIEKFLMMAAGVEPSNPALEKVRWVSMPSSSELFPE